MGSIVYGLLFLVSAAALALQICLTRVFALAQGYHFAFMSVSIGLLGFGASGSLLYVKPNLLGGSPEPCTGPKGAANQGCAHQAGEVHSLEKGVAVAALLFGAATMVAYLGANGLPLDLYLLGLEPGQWAYLLGYFALLALPFLFAGAATGLALSRAPRRAGGLYFASMVGSAAGAAGSLLLLNLLRPGHAVAAIALALVVSVLLWSMLRRRHLFVLALALVGTVVWLLLAVPDLLEVRTSPYKALNQALLYPGARILWQGQNAYSLVHLLESRGMRSAPGLSLAYQGGLPSQHAVAIDGENLSAVPSTQPGLSEFVRYLPSAAAYRLLSAGATMGQGERDPSVLVLEPGGGLEAIVALEHGANPVTVAVSNPALVEAIRRSGEDYLDDPRVRLVVGGARSYLATEGELFDLIVMPPADSFRVVTAGAFSVSESYLLTVESIARQYARVKEGGFLVVSRWLQHPPSEELRALLVVVEALERLGIEDPARRLAAFRSFQTATMLVKKGELQSAEMEALRAFAAEMRYDLVHLPGLIRSESNRFNVLDQDLYFNTFAQALPKESRDELLRHYPFDVSPTTDDRPFFSHFFKPSQLPEVIGKLGRTWQPFGGSGYLIMFALLGFALAASAVLILGPLWLAARWRADLTPCPLSDAERGQGVRSRMRFRVAVLAYFLGLGVGYLFVEMPLMQRLILLLDQPTYSFAVVLFALLLFSGLGSFAAGQLHPPLRPVLAILVLLAILSAVLLPYLLSPFLGQPLALRLLLVLLALAPLGFLMGMPFPMGIALLGEANPRLVPWAWGINGSASVVSSILASMIALSGGFTAVLALAGVAYGVSALAVAGLERRAP